MGSNKKLSPQTCQLLRELEAGKVEMPTAASYSHAKTFNSLAKVLLKVDQPFAESICSRELANIVWTVLIDAARNGCTPNEFSEALLDALEEASLVFSALNETYEKYGEALREAMQSIGWVHPRVVGINWSILSVAESNDDNVEIEEPLAEITFKTLNAGETELKEFSVLCNKNQLMDFQWKMREAENFIQKLAGPTHSTAKEKK